MKTSIGRSPSSGVNPSDADGMIKGYLEEEDVAQNFPFTAHIVLAIFIIIVSIVIMNLLFGMAVSDVQVSDDLFQAPFMKR